MSNSEPFTHDDSDGISLVPQELVEYRESGLKAKQAASELRLKLLKLLHHHEELSQFRTRLVTENPDFNHPVVISPADLSTPYNTRSTIIHTASIQANHAGWQSGILLDQGTYRLLPSTLSRYAIEAGPLNIAYGAGAGASVGLHNCIPLPRETNRELSTYPASHTRLIFAGEVAVLIYYHQADGTVRGNIGYIKAATGQNLFFYFGVDALNSDYKVEYISVGQHGASIHFMITDKDNAYFDNSGTCEVDVVKDV